MEILGLLSNSKSLVECTCLFHKASMHQYGRGKANVAMEQEGKCIAAVYGMAPPPELGGTAGQELGEQLFGGRPKFCKEGEHSHEAPGLGQRLPVEVDYSAIGDGPPRARMGLECRQLHSELGRLPYIVRVAERDPVALRMAHTKVARRRHACVGLPHVADRLRTAGTDRFGVVSRPVVNDQNLEGPTGLIQHRINRLPQPAGSIVRRNDDANVRHLRLSLCVGIASRRRCGRPPTHAQQNRRARSRAEVVLDRTRPPPWASERTWVLPRHASSIAYKIPEE